MKAVLFEPRHGDVVVEDIPPPLLRPGCVRIRNSFSLISAGTERSRLEAGRQGLVGKARERPDQAREVLRAMREQGPVHTFRVVSDRLSTPVLLGYSSAGVVIDVEAPGSSDVRVGSLVSAGGGGYAAHAEVVSVPANLCVPVPAAVSSRDAAFTTVGAIALQGVHQAQVEPGSRVGVIGLGLVGQLTVRLLAAYGYDVIGIDRDPTMLELARRAGVTAVDRDGSTDHVRRIWHGAGADAVLVTAATKSADPVELAGSVARDRATVVVVGDVLVSPPRGTYYGKELTVRYSRSYGPGRYDRRYEEEGAQYPEGYVPWPLRRNMQEFLRLLAGGLDVESLEPVVYPVEDASAAYDLLGRDGPDRRVAILLTYAAEPGRIQNAVALAGPRRQPTAGPASRLRIATAGAGSFPTRMLFPHLERDPSVEFSWIATAAGVTARRQGSRWGFTSAVAGIEDGLARGGTDCVMVLGPHAVHAGHAAQVLRSGVGVFCEKPLALTEDELDDVAAAWLASGAPAMAGFNRRFAPAVEELKTAMAAAACSPVQIMYRVFAGPPKNGHWSSDRSQGGRLLGEACHFIDTAGYLVGSIPTSVHAVVADGVDDPCASQSFTVHLEYADGSTACVVYAGRTPPGAPKELIEVAGDRFAARIEDFRTLDLFGRRRRRNRYGPMQKGHKQEMDALVGLLRGKVTTQTDFTASLWTSLATCRAVDAVRQRRPVPLEPRTPALMEALVGVSPRESDTEVVAEAAR